MIERKYILFAYLHLIIWVACTFAGVRAPETLGVTWILVLPSGMVLTLAGLAACSVHLKVIGASSLLMVVGLIANFMLLRNGPLHGPMQIFALMFGYPIISLLALSHLVFRDITSRRGQQTFSIQTVLYTTLAFAVPLSFSAILKPRGSPEFAAFLIFVVTIAGIIIFDHVYYLKGNAEPSDARESPM